MIQSHMSPVQQQVGELRARFDNLPKQLEEHAIRMEDRLVRLLDGMKTDIVAQLQGTTANPKTTGPTTSRPTTRSSGKDPKDLRSPPRKKPGGAEGSTMETSQ